MTDKFKLVKSEPYIENIETGECYDLDSDNFSYIVKVMNDLSNENEKLKQFQEDTIKLIQSFKSRDAAPIERILINNFEKELVEKTIKNNYKGVIKK